MNAKNIQSRREFLKYLGLTGISLPLLPSLMAIPSSAMADTIPHRFIFIRTAHGTRQENWDPLISAPKQIMTNVREGNLRSLYSSVGINKLLDTNFSPYYDQITFIRGLDIPISLGHNKGGALGHFQQGDGYQTIDQLLAKSNKFYRTSTPLVDSLIFSSQDSCSFINSGSETIQRQSYTDPQATFDFLFNFTRVTNTDRNSIAVKEALKRYEALRKNTRLSADDKRVLDIQTTLLNEINHKLKYNTPVPSIKSPVPSGKLNLTQIYESFVDVAILALLNRLTNIVVINIEEAEGISSSSWHAASHDGERTHSPLHYQASYWAAQKVFLRMIKKLSQIQDINGKSMLDNSLVFWGGEMSNGQGHVQENMPVVLAGSARGFIKTGRILDYSQYQAPKVSSNNLGDTQNIGRPYNQLLNTILQSMGLTPADYEKPGKPGYGLSASINMNRNLRYKDMISQIGSILPAI